MYEMVERWIRNDAMFYSLLLLLVGMISFGLGRLSVTYNAASLYDATTPITVSEPTVVTDALVDPDTANYVASKKGTKYHARTCPGAKQISDVNKIFFQTAALAQAAGYTLAGNCNE